MHKAKFVLLIVSVLLLTYCANGRTHVPNETLAKMGLGGGIYYSGKGNHEAFMDAWNGDIGVAYEGVNKRGDLVTYTPTSEKFDDQAYPKTRYDREQIRQYNRDQRYVPGGRYGYNRRGFYQNPPITCRDFTLGYSGSKPRFEQVAICQLPDGSYEKIPFRSRPEIRRTARRPRY